MAKKNITLIFYGFEEEHLGKDVFLVPYYLGKIYNMNVTIVCPATETNKKMPDVIKGVKIVRLSFEGGENPTGNSNYYKSRVVLSYVWKNAKSIDLLMTFHCNKSTHLMTALYKKGNSKGVCYIKADGNGIERMIKSDSKIKRFIYKHLINQTDIISFERIEDYNEHVSLVEKFGLKPKIKLVSNGFDNEMLNELQISEIEFSEKENIFLTVGRLGTYQKNTELLLSVLDSVDLKDWKCYLVGPIEKKEKDFQKEIDVFFANRPDLKDKVIFTGAIYDKKELWNLYNRAKVFVLTSVFESFGIVLGEAYQFKNYILTTDVGGAREILSNGFGEAFDGKLNLQNKMQDIIDGKLDLNVLSEGTCWIDRSYEGVLKGLLE